MIFSSYNPATGEEVWRGEAASPAAVDRAVSRARAASVSWQKTPLADREAILRAFARTLMSYETTLAEAISREVGKPSWEAKTEVLSMISKVDFSVKAFVQRCAEFSHGPAITRFRPHGVVAVFGPFNFPGHLPNGHIVPALLAGNTVIFKPSEHAPSVADLTLEVWAAAGLPPDVLQVVQGGRETGASLAEHPGIDGLFFTGSARTGLSLSELFASTPNRILALEMGGNNPLVVWGASDLRAAAILVIQSAFQTAGQRCTCARRLIISKEGEGDVLLLDLIALIGRIRVGPFTDRPEPFMGPVISEEAAGAILQTQSELQSRGGRSLVEAKLLRPNSGLLSPGLIDVTTVTDLADEEVFGPLLQVIRVDSFEAAIAEANRTRYGLAAGLLSDDPVLYERFRTEVRAGVINWNQPLTGASGAAPFGGISASGNHRPSGFFAADYCSYPVASIENPTLGVPSQLPPGLSL